jgi:hypothetical protein
MRIEVFFKQALPDKWYGNHSEIVTRCRMGHPFLTKGFSNTIMYI